MLKTFIQITNDYEIFGYEIFINLGLIKRVFFTPLHNHNSFILIIQQKYFDNKF